MLRSRRLAEFIERQGGADDQLFGSSKLSPRMAATVTMRTETGWNDYQFTLVHAHPDRFIFTEEAFRFTRMGLDTTAKWQYLGSGHLEAKLVEAAAADGASDVNTTTARVIVNLLRNCAVYQFHDTSDTSDFKKRWDVEDNNQLRSHGGNLAAVLHRLEREDIKRFELIGQADRSNLAGLRPFPDRGKITEKYRCDEKPRGRTKPFGAHLTSDGSLRFFALVTLLNTPPEMLPDVLLLDEPELGLHPGRPSP